MATAIDRYEYMVTWSEEDGEFVGVCWAFKSLSWLADSPTEALEGIRRLVGEVVADMKLSGEKVPEPTPSPTPTPGQIERRIDEMTRRLSEMEPYVVIGHAAMDWYLENSQPAAKDDKLRKLVSFLEAEVQRVRGKPGAG
jgi:predicted RNase H-like HicB family nuclease